MKNFKWILLVFALLLQVEIIWMYVNTSSQQRKLAVVNLKEVFDNFEYSKELEAEIQRIDKRQTAILDSLEWQITQLSEQLKVSTSEQEKEALESQLNAQGAIYRTKNEKFKQALGAAIKEFDTKIWNQINSYSKEFCESKNLDIVFGHDNAQRSVMYRKKREDITEELIIFINNRYNGQ